MTFVDAMQAALDKRRKATTQAERDAAIREMEQILRGHVPPAREPFDAKQAQTGERD